MSLKSHNLIGYHFQSIHIILGEVYEVKRKESAWVARGVLHSVDHFQIL